VAHPVLLLATVETKADAVAYLRSALVDQGLSVVVVDISLGSGGEVWDGPRKLAAIEQAAREAVAKIAEITGKRSPIVLGIGGGTGGDILLRIMRDLPVATPKVLVTTLPFDPRPAVADDPIVLVPSIVDIEGLNPSLRDVFDRAAAMVSGLARHAHHAIVTQSVGVTALGVTKAAGIEITRRLEAAGYEATAFHANGYGGLAFARYAREGAFLATIDMTVHEVTRLTVAGQCLAMPDRFTAAGHLPRVVLPGGLNFIGLGEIGSLPRQYLDRAHYQHSAHFTHIKMSPQEMERACTVLADALNQATAPTTVILPMGGFSSEDRPGGAIEDPDLRNVAACVLEARAKAYETVRIDAHISAPEAAEKAVGVLLQSL